MEPVTQSRTIVDPQGRPARRPESRACPRCGAGPERRVLSGGFGEPHHVCGQCGEEFPMEAADGRP